MNRVSVGLHVPGNVAISCKRCNNEKRSDDQKLSLASNGWESFLLHDGKEATEEPITPPGLPLPVNEHGKFITADCIKV